MSEQMDFNDGKYTVISDNGRLTALRNGEPWNRDITGDNLIYWMLVKASQLKKERDTLAAKLAKVEGQLAAVERLRPMWAQGHSTDSVAAQVSAAALTSLWDLLGVGNQTSAVVKLKQLLCVSAERDALAAKLKALEEQEPVAWLYDWQAPEGLIQDWVAINRAEIPEHTTNIRPLYARPVPAESAPKAVRLTPEEVVEICEQAADEDGNAGPVGRLWIAHAIETASPQERNRGGGMNDVTKDLLERIADISQTYDRFGATCTFEGQPMMHLSHLEEIAELAARAEAALAEHQPDVDGWIPWAGTDCPEDEDVVIEVRLRSGTQETKNAGFFDWKHFGWKSDIVAYRVVEAQP